MSNRLDPRMKQTIRNILKSSLYQHTDRRYNEELQEIIDRNTLLGQHKHACFTYGGVLYGEDARFIRIRLHPELHSVMDKLLSDRLKIQSEEEPYILAFFTRALNRSNSIQDYLLMFPDCLHSALNMFTTQEWRESSYWVERELSDEQIAKFKEEHEPWLEKLRNRMMIDLLLS